ncbi:MAG TPA: isocitrate lyase/phosphoenolpyruvate mutase family protein [Candidatus Bathyarchaeia archaeon]|nr:isocitrate lyase/phosphoenolpyruvate mutase family protein [Candidatus Bathyarchaeia archaeon]
MNSEAGATQSDKGQRLRALHQREGAFIIPNPYDAGTALLLEQLGFEALATTSSGYAFTRGHRDGELAREQALEGVRLIAEAVDIPVSADLENGFGDGPEVAAETIRMAAAGGAVGGSIEDSTKHDEEPIYDVGLAAERVGAAAEVSRGLPFPFTLTARAENFLYGRRDLADTIRRLQAYQEAGADVLYAPGLITKEEIAAVVRSVDRPVNVLTGLKGMQLTQADLSALGVRRISVGGGLCRAALGTFVRAAREMKESGTFAWAADAVGSLSEMTARFDR